MKPGSIENRLSLGHPVVTVGVDTNALSALRLMRQHRIHHLVVTSPEGVLGILSERQLIQTCLHDDGAWSHSAHVKDAYVPLEDMVTEDSDIQGILALMRQQGTSALPIVRGGKLLGIVTESDLVQILRKLLSESHDLTATQKGQIALGNPLLVNLMQLLAEAGI